MRYAWLLGCVVGVSPAAWADPITYASALARADAGAPSVAAGKAAADAARLAVGPAGQLPDPQLALGLDNFPVSGPDRYRLNRDEMTMMSVGIMQDVPNGALRKARTRAAAAEAGEAEAALAVARLKARLAAAAAWVELYSGLQRIAVLKEIAGDIASLQQAADARLASASAGADAALAARIDAARLADQLTQAEADAAASRADLERWIGPLGSDTPGPALPSFDIDAAGLRQHVDHHLELAGASAEVERARAGYDVARASRNPDWSWSLMYGRRDPNFGDMVSFGLKFSLPLFQSTRQSPTIDAKSADVARAAAEREALRREHAAMLEARLAAHAALAERLTRLSTTILPLAQQREDLAAAGQGAGTSQLADLLIARRARREAQLDRIDLERQLALIDAALSLEYGEGRS